MYGPQDVIHSDFNVHTQPQPTNERTFIEEYLQAQGIAPDQLPALPAELARELWNGAVLYALRKRMEEKERQRLDRKLKKDRTP
ncbi:MAG: hypothetical protein GYA17_14725 [Chloroflexi bacterium]|jgi:hypothetical protein|nr:hypothetical protein [Anaerolineaceae bacterium]NMB89610.1 hypothetical protein [Chloroflexota bacterium]